MRAAVRHPARTLAAWAVLLALATPWVLRLRIETATESFLDRSGAEWAAYQASQQRFGGDEIVTILLEGPRVFDRGALEDVLRVSRYFEQTEGVRRVDSLATLPVIAADAQGELSLEPALTEVPANAAARAALRARVERDRIAPRTTISADERAYAVNLVLEQGAEHRYPEILSEVDAVLVGRDFAVSGVPVFRVFVEQRIRHELERLVPITMLCLAGLLYLSLGSAAGMLLPLLVSAVGVWVGAGAMGAAERPITLVTVVLPSILLANGCAYSVHVLVAGLGRRGAELEAALDELALPVALSGATTALGFVASSAVPIDAIRDVGVFGGLGVLVVNFAALTLLPALLTLLPFAPGRRRLAAGIGARLGGALVRISLRRGGLVFAGWSVALALAAAGIARLHVETDAILWFSKRDPVRIDYEHIRARLSGISPINVVIEATGGGNVSDPEVVRALAGLTAHAESLPQVGRAISIADPLRQLHGGFAGDASDPLPGDAALIEQYLLLLDAKPFTRDLITSDRSAANVVLRVDDNGSGALMGAASELEAWWAENGPPGFRAFATGSMYEFARSEDTIAWGQIRGLGTAFVPIALVLFAIFRSLRLTLIALIPNVVPIAIAYGAMGFLGVPLDAGTVLIGSLALGIAVDDTIHVAEGYLTFRRRAVSPEQALLRTYERSLPALCFTTVVVAVGFAVLAFSPFTFTRNLGLVTSALMLLCFAADLLLFAPLLMRWLGTGREKR